jgi:glutamate-1-semialdehyde aminotransferase
VRELTAERIARMHALAERLERGLLEAGVRAGLTVKVRRVGSLLAINVSTEGAPAPDPTQTRFHLAALNHGLMFAPRGMMALATVLDEALIDQAIERAAAAMSDVAS